MKVSLLCAVQKWKFYSNFVLKGDGYLCPDCPVGGLWSPFVSWKGSLPSANQKRDSCCSYCSNCSYWRSKFMANLINLKFIQIKIFWNFFLHSRNRTHLNTPSKIRPPTTTTDTRKSAMGVWWPESTASSCPTAALRSSLTALMRTVTAPKFVTKERPFTRPLPLNLLTPHRPTHLNMPNVSMKKNN